MTAVEEAVGRASACAATWLADVGVPGASIVFTTRDGPAHAVAYGLADVAAGRPVTSDTLFPVASIAKAFTAACVLRAGIAPETRAQDVLPCFPFAETTIGELLSHTGGLIAGLDSSPTPLGDVLLLGASPPRGRGAFRYSNVAYAALGLAVEAHTGERYADLVQRHVLDPLRMADSVPVQDAATGAIAACGHVREGALLLRAPWVVTDSGAGSTVCTASDLGRWLAAVARREPPYDRMLQPVTPGYGLGLELEVDEADGSRSAGHSGDCPGFTSHAFTDLETGAGVVVLANGSGRTWPIVLHALALLRAALRGEPLPDDPQPEPARPPADEPPGVRYESYNPWCPWVEVGAAHLRYPWGSEPLAPLGPGRFRIGDADSPEWLELRDPVDGRPATAVVSGAVFHR